MARYLDCMSYLPQIKSMRANEITMTESSERENEEKRAQGRALGDTHS